MSLVICTGTGATLMLGDGMRAGQRNRERPSPARGSVTANWAQRQPSQNFWGRPLLFLYNL